MKFGDMAKVVGFAAGMAAAGAEGCKVNPHPDKTYSSMGVEERPRALSEYTEEIQQTFLRWQTSINALPEVQAAGVSIREVKPIHVNSGSTLMDSAPTLLRFQVVASDGRSRVFDTQIERTPESQLSQIGAGRPEGRQTPFVLALDRVRAEVVTFLRAKE